MRLRLCHQHSQFWPILTRFVDYYSSFRGPEEISIVVEPQGALMCRSSTLTVLANSGPFLRLLLTVLGSYVGREHSQFGRFWPVSWTITLFFGPSVISMIYEPRGAFTCRSMTLTILANFWSVLCTITRRFGVPERFP